MSESPDQKRALQLQLALAFYNAARSELETRQKMRDTTLGLYVAASGTVFGYVLDDNKAHSAPKYFILIIPVFSLFTSMMTSVQTRLIGANGQYCAGTLHREICSLGLGRLTQWDRSPDLKLVQLDTVLSRSRAFLIIIMLPSLFAILTIFAECPTDFQPAFDSIENGYPVDWLPLASRSLLEWVIVLVAATLFTYLAYRAHRHSTKHRRSMYLSRFREWRNA